MSCVRRGAILADSTLPVALPSRAKLAAEPSLDRATPQTLDVTFSGEVVELRRDSDPPWTWTLAVRTTNDGVRVLRMSLSEAAVVPLEIGSTIRVRYVARWAAEADTTRRAVSLRDAAGGLLLLLQDGDLMPPDEHPSDLEVRETNTVTYTESGRLERLCHTIVRHFRTEVRARGSRLTLAPGEQQVIRLGDERYAFTSVDAGRTDVTSCPEYRPDRFAWFLVRVPAAAE